MNEVIVIGLGQLGRVFAGGLLRAGCSVIPVNRGDDMAELAQRHPAPERVLVAVAENDRRRAAVPRARFHRPAVPRSEPG